MMRSFSLALLFSVAILILGEAHAVDAPIPGSCPHAIMKERYQEVSGLDRNDSQRRNIVTDLLNEIFSPLLIRVAESVLSEPKSTFDRYVDFGVGQQAIMHPGRPSLLSKQFGYTTTYEHIISIQEPRGPTLRFGVTSYNFEMMSRLIKITSGIKRELLESAIDHPATVADFRELSNFLIDETYNTFLPREHLSVGLLSLVQAIGLLTSTPVGHLTADELAVAISQPQGSKPSLVVQMALILSAGVLGPTSFEYLYLASPVTLVNGEVVFSKAMRDSFAAQREYKTAFLMKRENHGMGCPVGRCLIKGERSSLQVVLDAIVERSVLERVPRRNQFLLRIRNWMDGISG